MNCLKTMWTDVRKIGAGCARAGSSVGLVLALAGSALLGGPVADSLAAQEYQVRGVVADSLGGGVENAMVVALTRPDSVLARYSLTSAEGNFIVSGLGPGEYILQVTMIGYAPFRRDFAIIDSDFDAGEVNLVVTALELDELVVSVEHVPFVNTRDTLSYNPMAFQTPPNSTVEDLLRRLPGIEVDDDGSITAQGEDVEQVLVDGKEFFGGDPTVATRNLPADAIKQVDVYDKQSDMAEFTGIADGDDERTIDLKLREEAKVGHFGNAGGALGNGMGGVPALVDFPEVTTGPSGEGARYSGSLNLNRFSPETQVAVIAAGNNVGRAGVVSVGARGGAFSSGSGIGGGGGGFTESLNLGLNGSRDFGEDNWLRGSYFFNNAENLSDQALQRSGLIGPTAGTFSDETSRRASDNLNHRLNLNAQVSFSEGHDLRLRMNGGLRSNFSSMQSAEVTRSLVGDLINSAITDNNSDSDELNGSGTLTWRKRLRENGQSLIAEVRSSFEETDDSTDLVSTLTGVDRAGDGIREINQFQSLDGQTWSNSVRLSLTQPLTEGNTLELFARRNATLEDRDNRVSDLLNGSYVLNPQQSSGFERAYSYLRGGARFSHSNESSWATLGLQVQRSNLDGTVVGRDESIENGYTHLISNLEYKSQPKDGHTVTLSYGGSTREPSLNQLQPYSNNTNPLNVYVGNPDLQPEYRHRIRADYRFFDQFSFLNIFTYTGFTYTHNDISTARTFDERGFQTRTPINLGSSWNTNVGVNFGTPVRRLGLDLDLDYRFDWAESSERINLLANDNRVMGNSVEIRIDNRSKDRIDIRASAEFNFNDVRYSLNEELNRTYMNSSYSTTGTLYFGDGWELESAARYQVYDQDVLGEGAEIQVENAVFWNAELSKRLMNDRVSLVLGVSDILDQNQGIDIANTANYIQESRSTSLGRLIMLRLDYRLGTNLMRMGRGRR